MRFASYRFTFLLYLLYGAASLTALRFMISCSLFCCGVFSFVLLYLV